MPGLSPVDGLVVEATCLLELVLVAEVEPCRSEAVWLFVEGLLAWFWVEEAVCPWVEGLLAAVETVPWGFAADPLLAGVLVLAAVA